MRKIQMVDLHTQYQRLKPEIDAAIQEVVDSAAFIRGKQLKEFETDMANYLGVKHVIGCANGTDALQVAMMALGLKAGDEVITSNFTFVATAEVIALLGLTPVLVDVDPYTFTILPEAIEKAITPRTKAIVPVHLFGQCANMELILQIAKKHTLFLIEDSAQATGAEYVDKKGKRHSAGTMGDIGCTSFFPSKNLGCFGDGGALFTNNDDLADKIYAIVNHGMRTRYYHDEIGVNSRLDTMQAAILKVKLKYLDKFNEARQRAAGFYNAAFENMRELLIPQKFKASTHIYHQYTLVVRQGNRNELRDYLNSHDIPAMIYYPVPLHLQKAYKSERYAAGDFPVTEYLCENVISLPMHTELDSEIRHGKRIFCARNSSD